MVEIIAQFLGVFLSLVLVRFARMKTPADERRVYALGLVFAALLYVLFAVAGGANAQWLLLESLGVLIYSATAWSGLRRHSWILALGWGAHVAWDVSFHLPGGGADYTPNWYPWLCVSFDLVIARAALASVKRDSANSPSTT